MGIPHWNLRVNKIFETCNDRKTRQIQCCTIAIRTLLAIIFRLKKMLMFCIRMKKLILFCLQDEIDVLDMEYTCV